MLHQRQHATPAVPGGEVGMVDFKKLLNQTPEERAQAEKEIEEARLAFIESTKNDPDVIRMKKRLGEL